MGRRFRASSFREVPANFLTEKDFDFVPVGQNLYGYDLIVLLQRLNHHFNLDLDIGFLRNRPVIDIKPILVLMNDGRFSGYNELLGRSESGAQVRLWYQARDYESILSYVRREARNFIEKYQFLKRQLRSIRFPGT